MISVTLQVILCAVGNTMCGDGIHIDKAVHVSDYVQNSKPDFHQFVICKPLPQHFVVAQDYTFQINEIPSSGLTVKNDGPIGSVTFPTGWAELIPKARPGENVFQVRDGRTFVPPDYSDNPDVRLHVGPGNQRVAPQVDAAFRNLLQSKPATDGAQQLSKGEISSIAGIIRPFDGGNNQYHSEGASAAPRFNIFSAFTVNINGKAVLLITGRFLEGAQAGLLRESLYMDNGNGGIEQMYLVAPPAKFEVYRRLFWDTANSIEWEQRGDTL